MTKDLSLRAVISTDDKLSPALKKLKINTSQLSKSFNTMGQGIGQISKGLSGLAIPAGLLSVFSVDSVVGAVKQFASVSRAVQDATVKIGIAGETLTAWQYAAEQSGISADVLRSSLDDLNKNLYEVAQGKGKNIAEAFTNIGISVKNANGEIKSVAKLLPEISDAMQKTTNIADKNGIAYLAFGSSGQKMIPFLKDGSKEINRLAEEAKALGLTLNDDELLLADQLGDSFGSLSSIFTGLSNVIALNLSPALLDIISKFKEWFIANKDLIKSKLVEFAKNIAETFKDINFSEILKGIEKIITGFGFIIKHISTIGYIIAAVFGFKLIDSLRKMLPALKAVTIGIRGLTIAMASNPIGFIAAAIAAAAVLIITNWNKIKPAILAVWEGLKPVLDFLEESFNAIFGGIADSFREIYNIANSIFSKVKGLLGFRNSEKESISIDSNRFSSSQILQKSSGNIQVGFSNVPKGTDIKVKEAQNLNITADVGYASAF